jgi:hypothetical protein
VYFVVRVLERSWKPFTIYRGFDRAAFGKPVEIEDELFYVIKGKLLIKLRDSDIVLNEGESLFPMGLSTNL